MPAAPRVFRFNAALRSALFTVRVKPGSRESKLGTDSDVLVAQVRKRAENGEANDELRHMLSKELGVPVSSVFQSPHHDAQIELVRGGKSREKTLRVVGVSESDVESLQQKADSLTAD